MRYPVALLIAFAFAGTTIPVARGQSQAADPGQRLLSDEQKGPTKSPLEFLIDSAAADFHAQREQRPAKFRHVRLGHVLAPDGTKQYRLCGEFLPRQEKGKGEWTPFVTIKTSGYEQYFGAQAAGFCKGSTIQWDKESDLSSSLQRRFDSIR